jgi:hypothetical protein
MAGICSDKNKQLPDVLLVFQLKPIDVCLFSNLEKYPWFARRRKNDKAGVSQPDSQVYTHFIIAAIKHF